MATRANAVRQENEIKRKRSRRKRRPVLSALRLRELNQLLRARYGEQMPDTPDTRRAIVIVAHHLAALPSDTERAVRSWLELRAPWYSLADLKALVIETIEKPKRWKAHTLGWALKLNAADRKTLRLTTIGAADLSPAQRRANRRSESRIRTECHRRAKGAKPRAEYLAAVKADKPWERLGISRRTWYRKGKPPA